MNVTQAEDIIASDPLLMRQVSGAIKASSTPSKHRDTVRQCAAHLQASGFRYQQVPVTQGVLIRDGWAVDAIVDDCVSRSITELQRVNLLPVGLWSWLLALGFRWAVETFLRELWQRWYSLKQERFATHS